MSGAKVLWVVIVLAVVVAAFAAWLILHKRPPHIDPASLAFRECAADVGINFQMSFLPNEQGETFKINLYDHGAGVAVGDFDGDGFDDIYFLNQLGCNGLYRNKGDGTFEDVTDKAGVALGDRGGGPATFVDFGNTGHIHRF